MAQRIYPIIVTTWEALYKLLGGSAVWSMWTRHSITKPPN